MSLFYTCLPLLFKSLRETALHVNPPPKSDRIQTWWSLKEFIVEETLQRICIFTFSLHLSLLNNSVSQTIRSRDPMTQWTRLSFKVLVAKQKHKWTHEIPLQPFLPFDCQIKKKKYDAGCSWKQKYSQIKRKSLSHLKGNQGYLTFLSNLRQISSKIAWKQGYFHVLTRSTLSRLWLWLIS